MLGPDGAEGLGLSILVVPGLRSVVAEIRNEGRYMYVDIQCT